MAGQMMGSLDTQQLGGLLHDVQLDYYGKRVAAASSDGVVNIFDITDNGQKPAGQLKGHEGPVWKVAWAHPKFGNLVATCGYDMKVIVWKEVSVAQWAMVYVDSSHTASVNSCEFAPWEYGLHLACASSDGTVSVLSHQAASQQWRRATFNAHPGGAQTLSWMVPKTTGDNAPAPPMRLATGGCDHQAAVWKCEGDSWMQEPQLPAAHSDWVRCVAWRPDGSAVIASGGWDMTVVIWKQEVEGQPFCPVSRLQVSGKVEGVSWSLTGSILGVSFSEGETVLYKEATSGQYEEVGKVSEPGYVEVPRADAPAPHSAAVAAAFGGAAETPASPPAAAAQTPQAAQLQQQQQQQQAVLDSFGMM